MRIYIAGDDDEFPVYFQVKQSRRFEARELLGGQVFADYDRAGDLIGIEFLRPAVVDVQTQIKETTGTKP